MSGHDEQFRDTIQTAFGLGDIEIVAIHDINKEIAKLVGYGLRDVPLGTAPNYRIHWSNGGARWWMYPNPLTKKETPVVKLDANELLVSGFRRSVVQRIVQWLNPLPLYAASFEARERGVYDNDIHFTGRVMQAMRILQDDPPWRV